MNRHKKIYLYIAAFAALSFYYLAGIWFNPFILWTALPLYIGYALINSAIASESKFKLYASYSFIFISILLSLLYHLTWYLDWQGTKTSSSSSAIIFFIFPIYCVVLGFVGYAIIQGYAYIKDLLTDD